MPARCRLPMVSTTVAFQHQKDDGDDLQRHFVFARDLGRRRSILRDAAIARPVTATAGDNQDGYQCADAIDLHQQNQG